MIKKKIDKLIEASYENSCLNQGMVKKIASLISKSDLKKYINGLKSLEKKNSIIVSAPINNQNLRKFEKMFPHKKVVFKKDPRLMLGVRVVDNDIVYELTLRNSLDKFQDYVEQNYD